MCKYVNKASVYLGLAIKVYINTPQTYHCVQRKL